MNTEKTIKDYTTIELKAFHFDNQVQMENLTAINNNIVTEINLRGNTPVEVVKEETKDVKKK